MIKKFVLGTAQLNTSKNYGISNDADKINTYNIFQILEESWNKGIRYYDTAPSYNNEHIIGEFIKDKRISNDINILTKISSLDIKKNIFNTCFDSIRNSMKKCNVEKIHTIFFHNEKDFYLIKKEKNFFQKLSKEFRIENFGFSVYDKSITNEILEHFPNIYIQLPFNLINEDFKNLIKKTNIKTFLRSIFLQGLLVSNKIKDFNIELKLRHELYLKYIKDRKINPIHLSLDFINLQKKIDYVIFGVKNIYQLNEILNYKSKKKFDEENINNIREILIDFGYPQKWIN